jgi:pimeloyl-ACP methyl ester carboxylesterase
MGGMLATRLALMFPQKVEKLILENPIGLEDYKTLVPYQSVDQLYAAELKQDPAKMKAYQQENYYGGNWKPAYDKWLALTTGWLTDKDYPTVAWNSALTSEMIITQPVVYEFEKLTMPVLLIIGKRDRTAIGKNLVADSVKKQMGNYPVLGRQTAQRIKTATLVEIDNVGHLPHIEAFPLFMKPLLEFLAK